jgi:mannose-1-phosphate guanylyltransferase
VTTPRETWAIVLAGGEGRRLRGWVGRDDAPHVPKQYRRFDGGATLLSRTIERSGRFAPPSRTIVVVSAQQRPFWETELRRIPNRNRVVQRLDRGTGVALLAATTLIHLRNPGARVVSFPADHAVRDENGFADAVEAALRALEAAPDRIHLLGVAPDDNADGYGWILAGAPIPGGGRTVVGFEEKPTPARQAGLRDAGAFVDTFVFAARSRGLLDLYRTGAPRLLDLYLAGLVDGDDSPGALVRHYDRLPRLDLGRDLFPAVPERLAVVPLPPCGWTDLGTPERADRWLHDSEEPAPHPTSGRTS